MGSGDRQDGKNNKATAAAQVDWVSATDVGTFAYCGRLFWLTKVKGRKADQHAEARLAAGHEFHEAHGKRVEEAQTTRKHVIDSMLWSAIGLLIMWLATRFGLSGMSPWVDAGLGFAVIGIAAALSWVIRGRRLFRKVRLPEQASVVEADTHNKKGKTLRDPVTGLYGRPDYILEEDAKLVPVELKPTKNSAKLYNSDEMQLVHYLMLLERLNPQKAANYGRVVYAQAVFKIDLTPARRTGLLDLVAEIRRARTGVEINRTHNILGRCKGCSVRDQCEQAIKPKLPKKRGEATLKMSPTETPRP